MCQPPYLKSESHDFRIHFLWRNPTARTGEHLAVFMSAHGKLGDGNLNLR